MTKSELIENIVAEHPNITKKHIEFIINSVFASIKESLQKGEKVDVFGLIRDVAIGVVFGATAVTDVFFVALVSYIY